MNWIRFTDDLAAILTACLAVCLLHLPGAHFKICGVLVLIVVLAVVALNAAFRKEGK